MLESTEQTTESTTTKFKGDIIFNNGEKDVKVSELVTKSELKQQIREEALKPKAIELKIEKKLDDYEIATYFIKPFDTNATIKGQYMLKGKDEPFEVCFKDCIDDTKHHLYKVKVTDEIEAVWFYNENQFGLIQNEETFINCIVESATIPNDDTLVLKSQLSSYRSYRDTSLKYCDRTPLTITYDFANSPFLGGFGEQVQLKHKTAYVPYHEGAHLKGKIYEDYDGTFCFDFDIVFKTSRTNGTDMEYIPDNDIYNGRLLSDGSFFWDAESNRFLFNHLAHDDCYVELELAELVDEADDELVLKSQLNESSFKTTPANTTITHYCPIEESMNAITDFIIGSPVYLTGKVYKYEKNQFIPSTATDTTDCICSVKTNGKWNEFVGICVRIDEENKCVTFSSHGDYLVKVNDTSCYGVGDEVFVDDGELKVITGQTAITAKIRRTTVGIITAIIDEQHLSVFKQ